MGVRGGGSFIDGTMKDGKAVVKSDHLLFWGRVLSLLVVGGCSLYIIFALKHNNDREIPVFQEKPLAAAPEQPEFLQDSAKPMSYYQEMIARRDIFSFNPNPAAPPIATAGPVVAAAQIPPLFANLKLVGIVLDENPQAIVKDPQTNKTFFLYPGGNFNEAVVKEIREGKVVFEYQGQIVELIRK